MICRSHKCMSVLLVLLFTASAFMCTSCSSAPKRPAEIFTTRNAAVSQMELAHQAVMKGEPDVAKQFLSEAWRLAVASDDADTRARVLLATGNAWYSEGAVENALQMWKQAKEEAEQAHSAVLTAAANIHLARGNLAEGSGQPEMSDTDRKKRAEESRATVLAAQKELDGTVVYEAYAWRVLSLAEKELGNTDAALQAIDRAADIHDGENFLKTPGTTGISEHRFFQKRNGTPKHSRHLKKRSGLTVERKFRRNRTELAGNRTGTE